MTPLFWYYDRSSSIPAESNSYWWRRILWVFWVHTSRHTTFVQIILKIRTKHKKKEERPTSWLAIGTIKNSLTMTLVGSFSPAGRSLLGETVPEVFLFFSYWDLKVSGNFYYSFQPMCVEEGRVRVDVIQSARSIANQNKTFLTCNLHYHNSSPFRIKKGNAYI